MIWKVASLFLARCAVHPVSVYWFHTGTSWSRALPLCTCCSSAFLPRAERPSRAQVTSCRGALGTAAPPRTSSTRRGTRQEPALPSCSAGMGMLWFWGFVPFCSHHCPVGARTWRGAGARLAPSTPGGTGAAGVLSHCWCGLAQDKELLGTAVGPAEEQPWAHRLFLHSGSSDSVSCPIPGEAGTARGRAGQRAALLP